MKTLPLQPPTNTDGHRPKKQIRSSILHLCSSVLLCGFLPLVAFAGTNASVTINTNNFSVSPTNLWRSNATYLIDALTNAGFTGTGGGSTGVITNQTNLGTYLLTNSATGAFWQVTTNAHVHAIDENGTTFDTHPASNYFAIIATNTNSFTFGSNGVLTVSGQSNTATLILTGANHGGVSYTIQSTPGGLSLANAFLANAGSGASALSVQGLSLSGSGTVVSNFSVGGTNSAAVFAGSAAQLTNIFNALADGEVIVCPYTNLPASLTNSGKYFTPSLGANYVQQAFNALQYFTNPTSGVGGGRVTFVGVNYAPNSIVLTNALGTNTPCSWDIEAPAFIMGGLVGQQNPVLVWHSTNSANQLVLRNMIVASTVDQATNLIELTNTFGRIDIEMNWFGPWQAMTNNHIFANNLVGLTPPTTGSGYAGDNGWWTGNLVGIYLIGNYSDIATVSKNSFLGMDCGVFWNPDHGQCEDNMFSYCGTPVTNLWPNTSVFSLHCAIVLSANQNNTWHFEDNYFYTSPRSYFVDRAYTSQVVMQNDSYENGAYMVGVTNSCVTLFSPNAGSEPPTLLGATNNPWGIAPWSPQFLTENFDNNNGFWVAGPGMSSLQLGVNNQTGGDTGITDESGAGFSSDDNGNWSFNGGTFASPATGFSDTFNGTARASIVGNGNGVTNTSTNYGTAVVVCTSTTYSNFNSAGAFNWTNSSLSGEQQWPVGPNSGVKCASGGLTSAIVIFQ
jgi:hypothetical protein